MWEIRETSGIPDDNTCKRCIQLQLLEKRVRELEKELDDLRLIRENEMYIDSSFRDVVTPKQQSTGNWVTVRRGNGTVKGQAEQVSPVDIPLHNRFTELDTVVGNALPGTSCDSRNSDTESGSTAQKGGRKKKTAVVIGDQMVRGTDRRFCGRDRDSRMVCCLPGARVRDVSDRVHSVLKWEGDQPDVS